MTIRASNAETSIEFAIDNFLQRIYLLDEKDQEALIEEYKEWIFNSNEDIDVLVMDHLYESSWIKKKYYKWLFIELLMLNVLLGLFISIGIWTWFTLRSNSSNEIAIRNNLKRTFKYSLLIFSNIVSLLLLLLTDLFDQQIKSISIAKNNYDICIYRYPLPEVLTESEYYLRVSSLYRNSLWSIFSLNLEDIRVNLYSN